MKGTFLQPSAVALTVTNNTLRATDGNEFFAVMAVQEGIAPGLKVDGEVVRVGARAVRFETNRIRLA